MLFNFNNLPENLKNGVAAFEEYGFVESDKSGMVLKAIYGSEVIVEKSAELCVISYDTIPHFHMALLRAMHMENGRLKITPCTKRLGFMLDCSRNAVMKVSELKRLICLLALLGYTYLELYTEDTYELPDEPYFGYQRGRYTKEELREVIDFAKIFGIEVVPCIQTLAHLKTIAKWKHYNEHMDIADILLVGDERTDALIRKMLSYCKEVFDTDRIHIGMDEAFYLGRGKYTDTYGYQDKNEIYLKHLKHVFAMCEELGLKPEFWADGLYNTNLTTKEIQSVFNGNQTPIYWEYANTEKEMYVKRFRQLQEYAGKVSYAGGLWKWTGFAPLNGFTDKVMNVAFEAAAECGVEDILLAAWGDNGAECSVYAMLPSMYHAANVIYPINVEADRILMALTGYRDAEWRLCDRLNQKEPDKDGICNRIKHLLYNDFLIGLLDANVSEEDEAYYEDLGIAFAKMSEKDSPFAYLFQSYEAACKVLKRKVTYGKRLHKAYHEKDMEMLRKLKKELFDIKADLQEFYQSYRTQWTKENKGFGFEVIDARIGALINRTETVAYVLEEYIEGRIETIYELEDERLDFFYGEPQQVFYNDWATTYTVNII